LGRGYQGVGGGQHVLGRCHDDLIDAEFEVKK
jgi:hypothetical protein